MTVKEGTARILDFQPAISGTWNYLETLKGQFVSGSDDFCTQTQRKSIQQL